MHVKIIDIIEYICEKKFGKNCIEIAATHNNFYIMVRLGKNRDDLIMNFTIEDKYDMSGNVKGYLDCYHELDRKIQGKYNSKMLDLYGNWYEDINNE